MQIDLVSENMTISAELKSLVCYDMPELYVLKFTVMDQDGVEIYVEGTARNAYIFNNKLYLEEFRRTNI